MTHPADASTSQILGTAHVAIGTINFIAQGQPAPAKFCVIPKEYDASTFATEFFLEKCRLKKPKVLISVTGGAQDFELLSSKLEQIFNRGLLKAAENTTAWIISGGLDVGVMKFIGDSIRDQGTEVPCIGVATYSKVTNKELLEADTLVNYVPEKPNGPQSAALNPNHTHFILVDSQSDKWGEEIKFRTALEDVISREWRVPLVLVAVNGGYGTVQTVVEGVKKNFPTVIVEGSGRACDAMAAYVKHRKDPPRYSDEEWVKFRNSVPSHFRHCVAEIETLHEKGKYITIFNPNENATEDMDKAIFRSILTIHSDSSFLQKLELGIQWGRADVIEELLDQNESLMQAQEKVVALSRALQLALEHDRPEIYELLVSKGAERDHVNLRELYKLENVQYHLTHLASVAGLITTKDAAKVEKVPKSNERTRLTRSDSMSTPKEGIDMVKEVLKTIHPAYAFLLAYERVTFTDLLVWAVLTDRFELAKAVWRQTIVTVHSALLVCHLCKTLEGWLKEDVYTEHFKWFEAEVMRVINNVEYQVAVDILEWEWQDLRQLNGLELAQLADCKDVFSHAFVQRYLDNKFNSNPNTNGQIPPGTKTWRVLAMTLFPFTIPYFGAFHSIRKEQGEPPFFYFYTLPVVKLVSSTVSYTLFLILLMANLFFVDPHKAHPHRFMIRWHEVWLWIWVFAALIEESSQFFSTKSYLSQLSNRMDLTMYSLLVIYFVLRILARYFESQPLLIAYTDALIVATIACFLRVMNVFAVSKSLGPLFFVIIRLFNDVGRWLFIFSLFMLSFQAGIFALTRQAEKPAWTFFPDGSMGTAFTAILGDLGDNTMEWMTETHFGFGVLVILFYSLVTQVMLVNLLIAMMGDTYTSVRENSDKEWKFYRYLLIVDCTSGSPYPPPFNLIFGPYYYIKNKIMGNTVKSRLDALNIKGFLNHKIYENLKDSEFELHADKTILKMKRTTERVLAKEATEEKNTLGTVAALIREQMRILNTQRDSDRLYLEHSLKNMKCQCQCQCNNNNSNADKNNNNNNPANIPPPQ